MQTGSLIPLDRSKRLLKKVREYLANNAFFFEDADPRVSVLLDALSVADNELLLKILPLLAYAGKARALRPLYDLMLDSHRDEQVRTAAAVHLAVASSLSDDPGILNDTLIDQLRHPQAWVRSACALALGWEGNQAAVNALIDHFDDSDRDVQTAVVSALSSIGDRCVFDLLKKKLTSGNFEAQRSILLNLWRFSDRFSEVEAVYLEHSGFLSGELCPDLLSGMAMLPLSPRILSFYQRLLSDGDATIRHRVLDHLTERDPSDYRSLKTHLYDLLRDRNARVRQAAIRLFNRL